MYCNRLYDEEDWLETAIQGGKVFYELQNEIQSVLDSIDLSRLPFNLHLNLEKIDESMNIIFHTKIVKGPGFYLTLHGKCKDPHSNKDVNISSGIRVFNLTQKRVSKNNLLKEIRRAVKSFMPHELDEGFFVYKKQYFQPHGAKRKIK